MGTPQPHEQHGQYYDVSGARTALVDEWYARGLFGSENLSQAMTAAASRHSRRRVTFLSESHFDEITVGEMHTRSLKLAGALYALGLRHGDVIAIQVPNWLSGTLLYQAAMHVGAVIVPIIHIYGPAEVSFILKAARAKAFIVPDRWRNIDYLERLERLDAGDELQHVIVLGKDAPRGTTSWQALVDLETDRFPRTTAHPDDVCLQLFTSGTTAAPKGVLHSHNTLLATSRLFGDLEASSLEPGRDHHVVLGVAPAGHIAGVIRILRLYLSGSDTVLMDAWDPEKACRIIEERKVSFTSGGPYFIATLLDCADRHGSDVSSISAWLSGGTNVPPAAIERADRYGIPASRAYGSTEHPTATSGRPNDPLEARANTDGRPTLGSRVRIIDESGAEVPPGCDGEIALQGAPQFLRYTSEEANAEAFTADGWFRTGDIGRLEEDGFLVVTDRKKDIIIRGGENISSKEVEDVLARHPAVFEVAVTAMPDPLMGEKVCAFVKLRENCSLDLKGVLDHFVASGVAKQKSPERLVIVDEFPRTPAQKIKKAELRERLRNEINRTG